MGTYEDRVRQVDVWLGKAERYLTGQGAPDTARCRAATAIAEVHARLAAAEATREMVGALASAEAGEEGEVPSSQSPEADYRQGGRAEAAPVAAEVVLQPEAVERRDEGWFFVECPGPHAAREERTRARVIDPTPGATLREPNPRRQPLLLRCTGVTSQGGKCPVQMLFGEAQRVAVDLRGGVTA